MRVSRSQLLKTIGRLAAENEALRQGHKIMQRANAALKERIERLESGESRNCRKDDTHSGESDDGRQEHD